jgi:hypothetical protein
MTWRLAFLAMLAACGFNSPAVGDGGGSDAVPPDSLSCYGTAFQICLFAPPSKAIMLADNTSIDTDATDASSMCNQHHRDAAKYCVVAGTSFTLALQKTLTAHGSRPLVLLANGTMELSGNIDIASHSNPAATGPGALLASACPNTTPAAGTSGGYGGSFTGKGGSGSSGNPNDGAGGGAALGQLSRPAVLVGGCPGGSGGGSGGAGGVGGGAIALIATEIRLGGNINASGAGGHGGPASKSGGGGGGSGGMIWLDANTITLASLRGVLWANGGGGGQGGQGGLPLAGDDGNESPDPTTAASKTNGSSVGGNGGKGSQGSVRDGQDGISDASTGGGNQGGGGGGGGGAGFIHAPGITDQDKISPPSSDGS